jgi:hypothetical protein
LVLRHATLKEVGLSAKRHQLHPVEWILGVINLVVFVLGQGQL